jgi:glucosamine--fructose-6-phosphate aminotransferase (isomerizing)
MCGIVGAVAERNIEKILIEGLKRLEYRGYDSAGIAVVTSDDKLERIRAKGKVKQLEKALEESFLRGATGIAHTRWATHGVPSELNAHPLVSENEIAVVHNGIIENHDALRIELTKQGYQFTSETDTETVAHLLHYHYAQSGDLLQATRETVAKLQGAYALGIISSRYPERMIAVRQGSPLVIGKGVGENYIASDPLALLAVTQQFFYLEDNDIADISREHIQVYADKEKVDRKLHTLEIKNETADRGEYRHFMMKEIAEQPAAVAGCLNGRVSKTQVLANAFGFQADTIFPQVKQIQLIACGTSYHAALTARYWIESLAGIPCAVEIASEFRYRKPVVMKDTLLVCLSQSGETADTLAALRLAKKIGFLSTLAICNVAESSLVREADLSFLTQAGIEIGVASTKAFTTQLTALLMLTVSLGRYNQMQQDTAENIVKQLHLLPDLINETLKLDPIIRRLADRFADKQNALYLGRGSLYPIALEGALKLKEISYIHAEGYPAGELKHGPLALVDKNMPVIALAPHDELIEKIKSNLHEVRARGGELFVFADKLTQLNENTNEIHCVEMPVVDPVLAPIIYTIPMQLLAYHVAISKGTDVDQPRNLAKSVTVE